jgi:VanZ family protein
VPTQLIKLPSQTISWCRIACRTSAWTLALAIVILSLVPPSYRPVTEASHGFEHLAIFLATGLAFGAGYSSRPFQIAVALVIFSGTVELLQQWVPGRHARLGDFLVDATAAGFGAVLAATLTSLAQKNSIAFLDGVVSIPVVNRSDIEQIVHADLKRLDSLRAAGRTECSTCHKRRCRRPCTHSHRVVQA